MAALEKRLKLNHGVFVKFFEELTRWNWHSDNKRRFSMFIKACSNFMNDDELKDLQEIIDHYVERWQVRLLDAEEMVYRYHWGHLRRFQRRKVKYVNAWNYEVWRWATMDLVEIEEDLQNIVCWCRKTINAKAYDLDIDFTAYEDGNITGNARPATL